MSSRSKNIYFFYGMGVWGIYLLHSADIISPFTTKRIVQHLIIQNPSRSHEEIALEKMNTSSQFIRYKKANNALIKSADKDESYESFIEKWNEFTDINYISKTGKSVASIVCRKGDYTKLKFLLAQGLDPNQNTALYEYGAAEVRVNLIWHTLTSPPNLWPSHCECFKLLINSPAFNINSSCTQHEHDESALHVAVYNKKIEAIELLLNKKADPNIVDIYNNTPLHGAINNHFFRGIELLIKRGADFNLKNILGKSPKTSLWYLYKQYEFKIYFENVFLTHHDIACYFLAQQNLHLMLSHTDNI